MASIFTNAGKAIVTNLVSGLGGSIAKYIAWGTGAGISSSLDTTLFTEAMSTANDGTHNLRVTGSVSRTTNTVANDTFQVSGLLTADAGKTITNVGLFDTNGQASNLLTAPSGGNMLAKADFSGIVLNSGDSISFTLRIILLLECGETVK